ncbi:MAG: bifunctional adenosylcobinamide kinase/adenosylcobinamide-phosphate guanylyltransferase [Desulfomicrobium escambiense]|nr:bifunctional adenosylcobinamide kinase/adenosylcobinamide-phosphate guanylyltransferase [Desulfomicrobium escambiense]
MSLLSPTSRYYDDETKERIQRHKQERPLNWQTYEEYVDLAKTLNKINAETETEVAIIDCLTLFISNLMLDEADDDLIYDKIDNMLEALREAKFSSIIVSNEVGMGIVPENKLARRFREVAGRINQTSARAADEVYLVAAGIPLKIK